MDISEIDSMESYDFRRARLCMALKWLLGVAYGPNIPKELRDPLPLKDKDTVTAIYVNTGLVTLLVNARLYKQAFSNLFPKLPSPSQGSEHWAIIERLSRLGTYVEDDHGRPITEVELAQTNPFLLTAHVCLIESMMRAYVNDTVLSDKVVLAVKSIGPFNASEDLPIDQEDALLVWLNKVSSACYYSEVIAIQQSNKDANSHHALPKPTAMDDILKDICDGCSLCLVISYYCPGLLKYSDINLTQPVGIGESLHNLCLIRTFCRQYLPYDIYYFSDEDILYSTDTIKPCLLAFLSQLFYYLVLKPLDFVRPRTNTSTRQVKNNPATPLKSFASREPNQPGDLISNTTRSTFSQQPRSNSTTKLSTNSEIYGSNPSLNSSTQSGTQKLLQKRALLAADTNKGNMHDTLSPIVMRKSQSMSILNAPDPKQSLVAWENNPYFIDRTKINNVQRTSNGNASLLSNVSLDPDLDEKSYGLTHQDYIESNKHHSLGGTRRNSQDLKKSQTPEPSSSYLKLLDRSADLESPLKQFAQKHGFKLPQDRSISQTELSNSLRSPSPETSKSELTRVTPRPDSQLSPRQKVSANTQPTECAQSYIISADSTQESAEFAGIPVIRDDQIDSFNSAVTLTSMDDIEPFKSKTFATNNNQVKSADHVISMNRLNSSPSSPVPDALTKSPASSLKQQFEQTRQSTDALSKTPKKTTFSLNQTTWTESAMAKRQDIDSDTASESSDASNPDRKSYSDVKILLEEKRKAMEKKKTLEEMQRTKELNNASRQAFMKAVSKNRSNQGPGTKGSDALKAFSRSDIAKSIENLTSKWQQDERDNAKRAAVTAPAKGPNLARTVSLDNITEVSENTESDMNKVPPAQKSKSPEKDSKPPVADLHEAPLDVKQFGLDKLNESLNELKGELKKISNEQKRLEELQLMVKNSPQSRSTPTRNVVENLSKHNSQYAEPSIIEKPSTDPILKMANGDNYEANWSRNLSSSSDILQADLNSTSDSRLITSAAENDMSSSCQNPSSGGDFTNPRTNISQSSEEPFILHKSKHKKGSSKSPPKVTFSNEPANVKAPNQANSNGFLSSSQLSKRQPKATDSSDSPSALDLSSGRRKWGSANNPVIPGYEQSHDQLINDKPGPREQLNTLLQEPYIPFKAPADLDTPLRQPKKAQQKQSQSSSDDSVKKLVTRQLSNQNLPFNFDDTPIKNPSSSSRWPQHDPAMQDMQELDTPMRSSPSHQYSDFTHDTPVRFGQSAAQDSAIQDTPLRQGINMYMDDTPMRQEYRAAQHGRPVSVHGMSASQTFYNPLTQPKSPPERDTGVNRHYSMSDSPIDTPLKQNNLAQPPYNTQAHSRHGMKTLSEQPLDLSSGSPRYMSVPYATESAKPAAGSKSYKLNAPYGNAENEVQTPTNISLTHVMEALHSDLISNHRAAPANSKLAYNPLTVEPGTQSYTGKQAEELQIIPPSYDSDRTGDARLFFYNPETENLPAESQPPSNQPPASLLKLSSIDNDDKSSVRSYSSGSMESEMTSASSQPRKRPTWDMSTPKGEILNQPGVGFIVAEQAQLTEDEIQRRKEKILMMQLKRKEDKERKKQEKAAELAAKAEEARKKDAEAEKKKAEEKFKREAILQDYQIRKAAEELPPEMRIQFRQKQSKPKERPATIHWSGSSGVDLNLSDHMTETGSSFTVSLTGSSTHRRPMSPAGTSIVSGNLTNRSKAPSRGPSETPADEYSGPKLYVKPSDKQRSNRTIIINAISHCCLAGVVNNDLKNKVLEEIAKSDGKHFLILFRDGNQTYKGIYSFCPETEECSRVHGQGPKHIKDEMCHRFYKYNSGGKSFTEVLSTKHLSVSIDAITIHNHIWQKNKK